MTTFLFPDNTVLCNFACVNRCDLLKVVLDGRGRWTAALEYEASRSARFLPALRSIALDALLGAPIEIIDEAEIRQVDRIRRAVFGGTDDQPLKHLGEAESCFLLKEREEFADSWWITDDAEALRHARFQGITTRETIDLMGTAVVNGDIPARDAYELMHAMAALGRHLRLPNTSQDLLG